MSQRGLFSAPFCKSDGWRKTGKLIDIEPSGGVLSADLATQLIRSVTMGRQILTILGTALLVTATSADAFAQPGGGGNGNNGQNNGRHNGWNGNGNENGNRRQGGAPAVPEIALASGASALALLAGGLLVLRGRRD
jgi:hypothetical protein